jgi:hypothetical protein
MEYPLLYMGYIMLYMDFKRLTKWDAHQSTPPKTGGDKNQ